MKQENPVDDDNSEAPARAPGKIAANPLGKSPCHKTPSMEKKRPARGLPLAGRSSPTATGYCAGAAAGLAFLAFFGAGALRDCGWTTVSSTTVPSSACPGCRQPSGT